LETWPDGIFVMGKAKLILGLAILGLAVVAGWQIASCEIANLELQTDMRDIAAQVASRIGLEAPSSDEDLQNAVIHKAREHDIQLEPAQVTVKQTGSGKTLAIYLAADYKASVNLLLYSFSLHFTPSSAR
jgi:Zn-dependent alcohol dehydrogenase